MGGGIARGADAGIDDHRDLRVLDDFHDGVAVLDAEARADGRGQRHHGDAAHFLEAPREQRIVPQIQGPYYHNFYGGKRHLGYRHPWGWHEWNKKKFYQGYHFVLDVF